VPIWSRKRSQGPFDRIDNDRQVFDAYFADKTGDRPHLHQAFGGGARGSTEKNRRIEALHVDMTEAGSR
jgi:hypothetical protein